MFRPGQAFNVSSPWPQCHAQSSTKSPIQFLGLLDTTKIDVICFAPVAWITGVIFCFWGGGGGGGGGGEGKRQADEER